MNATRREVIIRRRNRTRKQTSGIGRTILKALLVGLIIVLGGGFATTVAVLGAGVAVYANFAKDLPNPEGIEQVTQDFETTKIYDRTGEHLLYEVFDPQWGDRSYRAIGEIPLYLRNATVAIEDKTFYENIGVDFGGLARAFLSNLRGDRVQGGSSITVQLVKNVLIPADQRYKISYARKIKESILAIEIARRYPGRAGKDKILELYLNNIFYGNLAYGAEAAAQTYFGKTVQQLDLAESAMLAAIPQNYVMNPIDNMADATKRQHLVLDAMLRQGYITVDETIAAKAEKLTLVQRKWFNIKAPHFSLYVTKQLEEELGPDMLYQGGLRVYTTLDWDLQQTAEAEVTKQLTKLQAEKWTINNMAAVSIRPGTGEILAMVGSVDYFSDTIKGQVNIATSERQPGSSFKPFTYVTAMSQGYTPATMLLDVRQAFEDPPNPPYVPEDYSLTYMGPQRARLAMARSLNIPAVEMLSMVGVKNVLNTAHRMGINSLNRDYYGLSLTLGGGEVTLLDMAYAYSVFANSGTMAGTPVVAEKQRPGYRMLNPVSVLLITDRDGNVVRKYDHPDTREVLSPQLAYLMQSMMSDNDARAAAFGYDNPLKLSRPAGAKTGTTNDFRDDWVIGYTPQLVTAVWCGNTDYEPMGRIPASQAVAPAWHEIMEKALANQPVMDFRRPNGIVEAVVCSESGMLPNEHCPNTVKEVFIEGTVPTAVCDIHREFKINKQTGKLATVFTPPELVESKVYEILPPKAADWVRESNIPQPPNQYDDMYGVTAAQGDVAIITPGPYAYLKQGVVIQGNARSGSFQQWRLEYGKGLNPSAWSQIGGDHSNQVTNGPLEFWDVSQLDGLYTLQLTVINQDRSFKQAAIQVNIDNGAPMAVFIHPLEGDLYTMEIDDYINMQVDASDNLSMDRVEFYVDGQMVNFSTIAPYSVKWTIAMSDHIPVRGTLVTATEMVTQPDGSLAQQVVTVTQVVDEEIGLVQHFRGGMSIIVNSGGYTETHTLYAIAYDSAGNKTETEKVHVQVIHRPKATSLADPVVLPPEPVAMVDGRRILLF